MHGQVPSFCESNAIIGLIDMEVFAGNLVMFIVFIASSASLALTGALFHRGELLELITLIDLSKHDRAGIAKVASMMMFAMALSSSAAAILFWVDMPIVLFGFLAAMVLICLIGYICMARVPKTDDQPHSST